MGLFFVSGENDPGKVCVYAFAVTGIYFIDFKMTLADAYMQVIYFYQAIDLAKIKPTTAIAKLKSLIDKVSSIFILNICYPHAQFQTNNCEDHSEKKLLTLEREAFAQIFLQVMALNLANSEGSQGV